MTRLITLLAFLVSASSGLGDDEITVSPKKTFKIIQHYSENWTEIVHFTKGQSADVTLEYGISWPAQFYISPDEQWILRIQKSGSGDNISYLYRIAPNQSVWRMEQQIGQLGFDFIQRDTDLSKLGLYHTGIEFISWDIKACELHFEIHGSFEEGNKGLKRKLIYNLRDHTISAPKSNR